jgi:radical SAM-linked protein
MRDIVNKNVTENDVLTAAEEAFRTGRTTLKLYFMIGLPWETDDDVLAIADLCLKVRQAGRDVLAGRAARLQLNVSVNTFVPKPFTPFQWAEMADRETLQRRQGLLRARLKKPGIRLAMSDLGKSYLEAALARGDEQMGAAIEAAWRKGARFDPWTEQFRAGAWAEALQEAGASAEAMATAPFTRDRVLSWDVVEGVPDRDFLWAEWEKASRGGLTGDCRWDGCAFCGACEDPPGNQIASAGIVAQASAPQAPAGGRRSPRRYVARFSVTGRGRFLGHLDRIEAFRRAVRRAGGDLALSAGMRPKPLLSLALPLGVGIEGLDELCEFELADEPAEGFAERLATALPGHMRLLDLRPYEEARRLAARVTGASYQVMFSVSPSDADAGDSEAAHAAHASTLSEGATRFAEAGEWVVEETREERIRVVDVKRYVKEVHLSPGAGGEWVVEFTAAVTPAGTARPGLVLKALEQASALKLVPVSIQRTGIQVD